jgi:hypothetical protein
VIAVRCERVPEGAVIKILATGALRNVDTAHNGATAVVTLPAKTAAGSAGTPRTGAAAPFDRLRVWVAGRAIARELGARRDARNRASTDRC